MERTPRRHVLAACDLCRKLKIKCDGQPQCHNCINRGVGDECTYRPQKKRGKKGRQQALKTLLYSELETEVYHSSTRQLHYDFFFTYINPHFNVMADLDKGTTKAKQLQRMALLSLATRAWGSKTMAADFNQKAKQLARDLVLDWSHETATGLALLAQYHWADDIALASHFATLGWTISKRLKKSQSNFTATENFCFLMMCFTDCQPEYVNTVGERLEGWELGMSKFSTPGCEHHNVFQALVFQAKVELIKACRQQEILTPCELTSGGPSHLTVGDENSDLKLESKTTPSLSPWRGMTLDKSVGLKTLEHLENANTLLCTYSKSFGPTWFTVHVALGALKIVILTALGEMAKAMELAEECVSKLEGTEALLPLSPPFVPPVLFTIAIFAYQEGRPDLIMQLARHLEPLQGSFPIARNCMEKMRLMVRLLENAGYQTGNVLDRSQEESETQSRLRPPRSIDPNMLTVETFLAPECYITELEDAKFAQGLGLPPVSAASISKSASESSQEPFDLPSLPVHDIPPAGMDPMLMRLLGLGRGDGDIDFLKVTGLPSQEPSSLLRIEDLPFHPILPTPPMGNCDSKSSSASDSVGLATESSIVGVCTTSDARTTSLTTPSPHLSHQVPSPVSPGLPAGLTLAAAAIQTEKETYAGRLQASPISQAFEQPTPHHIPSAHVPPSASTEFKIEPHRAVHLKPDAQSILRQIEQLDPLQQQWLQGQLR